MSSFCIEKATHIFAAKLSLYLKFVINERIKLMMLKTTGPWLSDPITEGVMCISQADNEDTD